MLDHWGALLVLAAAGAVGCAPPAEPGASVDWLEPYSCGWERADPGTLESTGAAIGDVIADFSAPDQCGDDYRIWDSYGQYTLLLSVPFW